VDGFAGKIAVRVALPARPQFFRRKCRKFPGQLSAIFPAKRLNAGDLAGIATPRTRLKNSSSAAFYYLPRH
jgi:hypothetical protein